VFRPGLPHVQAEEALVSLAQQNIEKLMEYGAFFEVLPLPPPPWKNKVVKNEDKNFFCPSLDPYLPPSK